MKCIYCEHPESKVVDSRPTDEGTVIRRRRECLKCGKRFTTYEKVEQTPVLVIKKDGRRVMFDPEKIRTGMLKATEKRPVPSNRSIRLWKISKKPSTIRSSAKWPASASGNS